MENKKLLNQSVACKRLRAVGLTQRQTLDILNLVHLWTKSSGEEWTIKRLKSLKVAYINKLAGSPRPFKHSPWISRRGDIPKGVFAPIFKLKNKQKALSALMVYTSYVSKEMTKSQLTKFVTAVTSPSKSEASNLTELLVSRQVDNLVDSLSGEIFNRIAHFKHSHPTVFSERQIRIPVVRLETPKDPDLENLGNWTGLEFKSVIKTAENNISDFISSFSYPTVSSYYDKLDTLPQGMEETLIACAFQGDNFSELEELSAGRISALQEAGYKGRFIAIPHPSIQVALSRLANKVYSILRNIEEDCTFNQDQAILNVQDFLNSNSNTKGLMSIDLSSATDRFPLSLQLIVLNQLVERGLLDEVDVQLFSEVSQSNFTLPDGSTIKWEVGQPLGVFPSFGVFALTHNMLAQSVQPAFYQVLGDDIVIDYEAGIRLRRKYSQLGLDISEDKSIASKTLAEFGGRLISNNKTYVQPKWKDISDRSFIELARNLGPKSMGLFKPRQRRILKILSDVHPDVHTWGLNWNVKNLTYDERIALSNDVMQHFLDEESDLISLRVDQIELRDLKWGLIVKEFFDNPCLVKKADDYIKRDVKSVVLNSISKSDDRKLNNFGLESDFLGQFNLSCSDYIYSKANIRKLDIGQEDSKPHGFGIESGVAPGDPRGLTTLEVAEKKIIGRDKLNEDKAKAGSKLGKPPEL